MAENQIIEYIPIEDIGSRKHPQYDEKYELWDFLLSSYRGGLGMQNRTGMPASHELTIKPQGYYAGLFKWRKENQDDYINRVSITPYRPYARRIVKAFVNYVTKDDPARKGFESYAEYINNIDLKGTDIKSFVRSILALQKVIGEYNILVDMPALIIQPISKYEMVQNGTRPYCIPVSPQNIVDWNINDKGLYDWLIIENTWYESLLSDKRGKTHKRRTFWNESVWQVYEQTSEIKSGKKQSWGLINSGEHPCGRVPVIRVSGEDLDYNPETPESWFYDLADINRAIYNLESIDIENFHTQCFGQLIMPGKTVQSKEQARIVSSAEAMTETPEESGISRFIQPSGIEHETIETKIMNLRMEMYRIAGLFHRTDSRVAESAEAKAWDHEEMFQFLTAFSQTAEYIETQIFNLIDRWTGKQEFNGSVEYPKNYAVEDIERLMTSILDLKQIGFASELGRKETLKRVYKEILGSHVSPETMQTIEKEIDNSTEENPLANFTLNNNSQSEGVTV